MHPNPRVVVGVTVRAMHCSSKYQTSEMADYYRRFRPSYGSDVFDTVASFCKEKAKSNLALAVDVGCGSGQSTVPLTKYFKKVIGVDSSQAQISRAPTHIPGVSFRVASGEDLSFLDASSVDAVTMAACLHWMDSQKVFCEVERVLKPGGAFIAYSYGTPDVDEPQGKKILDSFFKDHTNQYIPSAVEERYHNYTLPFPGWRRNDDLKLQRSWTVDELVGFIRSWSSYQKYLLDNPESSVLSDLRERLQSIYQEGKGDNDEERKVLVTWSIFMLMGHKPQA